MARICVICAILCALAAPVTNAAAQEKVKAWEEQITIPTYKVYPDNPYPFFDAGASGHKIYPYARQADLSREKIDQQYTVLRLENEYLRVTVAPFLGGKLYDLYDKIHGREVFYTNHVIKPALYAIRGAWCSGGLEFNFPYAHTASAFTTVDCAMRHNPDGSASIVISDIEKRYRMKWIVTLTLYPGSYYVEQSVKLYNRSDSRHRYYWWAIAAVPVNDDCQMIYPAQRIIEHWRTRVYTWPVADGSVEPALQGKDISVHKNIPHSVCWSAYCPTDDFFAYYDFRAGAGIGHYGDRRILEGTKFWDFGNTPTGYNAAAVTLTDDDGPYNEIDSGLYLTQTHFHFLPPQGLISWSERWFPLNGLEGCAKATANGALNVVKTADQAEILLNANEVFEDARLLITTGDRAAIDKAVTIRPGEVFRQTIPYRRDAGPIAVRLTSRQGEELIDYVEKPPVPDEELPEPGISPAQVKALGEMTVEEAYVEGINRLRFEEYERAFAYFEGALEKDPGHSRTHNALGVVYYQRAMWDTAAQHFTASLEREPDQGVPHYYLGLIHKRQGQLDAAIDELSLAAKKLDTESAAHQYLGEIALVRKDFAQAVHHFSESLVRNTRAPKTRTLLAIAYRRTGSRETAAHLLETALREDPTNYLAAWESYSTTNDPTLLTELRELTRLNDHTYIELACDYAACGLYADACNVLNDIIAAKGENTFPMVYFYLGYFSKQQGVPGHAQIYRAVQDLPGWNQVFPNRLEALAVLEDVTKECPSDYLACFALGNLLMSQDRPDEAIRHWETAAEIVESLSKDEAVRRSEFITLIYRNLGHAYKYVKGDAQAGFVWYEKGLRYDPHHAQYYRELGEVADAAGRTDLGIKYLEAALHKVRKPSFVVRGLVPLYVSTGNDDRILELVEGHQFDNWEGEYTVYNWYKDAHLRRARRLAQESKLDEAAADFEKALRCPENLGSMAGVSYDRSVQGEAEVYWELGSVYKKLGDDERAQDRFKKGAYEPPPEHSLKGRYYCGLCLEEVGDDEGAARVFDGVIEYASRTLKAAPHLGKASIGEFHYYIGIAYAGKGEKSQAVEHLRICVESLEEQGSPTNTIYKQAKARLEELGG